MLATLIAHGIGIWSLAQHAARCAARSLGHAGDRLHRISRPGAAGGRGSGDLSARDRAAGRAACQGRCAASPISRVSFVYVVFEDGTDLYWARSRVLEYLNFAAKRLPQGVTPALGPDASGVGWVYRICGARRAAHARRAAQHPGLVRALSAHHGQRRRRGRERRRLRAAISGRRRSAEAAGLRHSARSQSREAIRASNRMSAAARSR